MFSKIITSTVQVKRFFKIYSVNRRPDWNKAVSEAKKIVKYPTSSFTLRSLANDGIPNVNVHLQELVDGFSRFTETTTNLVHKARNSTEMWGLVTLLISKAAGHHVTIREEHKIDGILHNQRVLAEISEMIRTGYLIHKEIVNTRSRGYCETTKYSRYGYFENMAPLLNGDYFFCYTFAELSLLRNHDLAELMISAAFKLFESEFIGRRDEQNNPIPPLPTKNLQGYAITEWTLMSRLSVGDLFSKSCQGSLKLAGYGQGIQSLGYQFGEHLAFAWQASLDLCPFNNKNQSKIFNLYSAPVLFHIEHDPSILNEIDKGQDSIYDVDYDKLFDIIIKGPGIELTKQLQRNHSLKALEILRVFQDSDANTALSNIITAMEEIV